MSNKRSTGYQPDVLIKPGDIFPGVTHRTMIGALVPSGNLPVQVDNTGLIAATGGIHDQDATQPGGVEDPNGAESCTGWEFAESFGFACVGSGYEGDAEFAGGFCYTAGRSQGRLLANFPLTTPLLDAGCAPTLVVDGCRKIGVPTLAAVPYDPSKMAGDEISLAGAVDGIQRAPWIVSAYAAIEEPAGDALENAIQQALATIPGCRVSLALFADPSFQQATGAQVLSAGAAGTVNHMVGIAGYFRVVAVSSTGVATLSNTMQVSAPNAKVGDYLYPLVNHWGRQWSPNCPLGAGTVLIDRTRLFQAAFFGILNVKPVVS
jgi:hypothetical protein